MAKGIGGKAKPVLTVIVSLLVIVLLVGIVYKITSPSSPLPPGEGGGEPVEVEEIELDEEHIIF